MSVAAVFGNHLRAFVRALLIVAGSASVAVAQTDTTTHRDSTVRADTATHRDSTVQADTAKAAAPSPDSAKTAKTAASDSAKGAPAQQPAVVSIAPAASPFAIRDSVLHLADSLWKAGDSTGAITALKSAGDSLAADTTVLVRLFTFAMARRDWKTAETPGEVLVLSGRWHADAPRYLSLAMAFVADSQTERAATVLSRAARAYPTAQTIRLEWARLLLARNEPDRARSVLQAMHAHDTLQYQYALMLGRAFAARESMDSALAYLDQARTEGAGVTDVGTFAMSEGNRWYAKANEANDVTAWIRAQRYLQFAIASFSTPEAEYRLGVATYNIAMSALADGTKAESCELLEQAAQGFDAARAKLSGGVEAAFPDAVRFVKQIDDTAPNVAKLVKKNCKK